MKTRLSSQGQLQECKQSSCPKQLGKIAKYSITALKILTSMKNTLRHKGPDSSNCWAWWLERVLWPSTHGEANPCLTLRVVHCVKEGLVHICIRTVEMDVEVLAVSHYHALGVLELWVTFGIVDHLWQVPTHHIANILHFERVDNFPCHYRM